MGITGYYRKFLGRRVTSRLRASDDDDAVDIDNLNETFATLPLVALNNQL